MSMVGYILGLGDRHPSNIMLDRYSGKVIHIDFGDCFEIAMRREKFPEKIPFRLTRMLIKAMEVSGIEGNFRTTCENTMRVMRASKESMLAILEAFVYDPLISFKLLNPKILKSHKTTQQEPAGKDLQQPEE
jgi:FKBP12-rapamycin complex-associated protein